MIICGTRDDEYGVTSELFGELYDKNEGFNREASRNMRTIDTTLDKVMVKGGKSLVERNPALVEMLLTGAVDDDD